MLAAGSTLCDGRYRLEEVVGRGGMAAVWRATDLQLERPVAIKVISDVLAGDPQFVSRFEREARLAAGLNHPNLVKLFDYSVDSERPFLVMEYVAGGTLVDARDRVDPVVLARELLDALAHIHGAGILHRDVKPANVLVGPDGSPRLTDFGIARSDDQTGLTLTGQVMGTLRYIAPEVAEGRPATAQSDLYSLGVLLGEVAGPDAPSPLGGLLLRMTAADPAERPASAADALAELEPTRGLADSAPLDATVPLVARSASAGYARSASAGSAGSASAGSAGFGSARPARTARPGFGGVSTWIRRSPFTAAALVVVALIVVIALATSGGSNDIDKGAARVGSGASPAVSVPSPASADAPLGAQLDALERIVRAAPRRRQPSP